MKDCCHLIGQWTERKLCYRDCKITCNWGSRPDLTPTLSQLPSMRHPDSPDTSIYIRGILMSCLTLLMWMVVVQGSSPVPRAWPSSQLIVRFHIPASTHIHTHPSTPPQTRQVSPQLTVCCIYMGYRKQRWGGSTMCVYVRVCVCLMCTSAWIYMHGCMGILLMTWPPPSPPHRHWFPTFIVPNLKDVYAEVCWSLTVESAVKSW